MQNNNRRSYQNQQRFGKNTSRFDKKIGTSENISQWICCQVGNHRAGTKWSPSQL